MSRQVIWRRRRKPATDFGQNPHSGAGRVVLLIDCADRVGLVARVASLLRVAGLLYDQGAKILHADQHQDHELGLFFMRVEGALESVANSTEVQSSVQSSAQDGIASFTRAFTPMAQELQMRWQLHLAHQRPRVERFGSPYLHCIADLLYGSCAGQLACEIAAIVSKHRHAGKARRHPRYPL